MGQPIDSVIKTGTPSLSNKVQVKLPFGLTMPKRPRAPEKRKRKRKPQAKKVPKPKVARVAVRDSDSDASSSDSSSDAGHDSEGSDPHQGDGGEGGGPDDRDQPVPPTATAEAEAQAIQAAYEDFENDRTRQADMAAQVGPQLEKSDFFGRTVGFEDADFAATSRSKCYFCNNPIPKGECRLSYLWSTTRPTRWMHSSCVLPFVQADVESRKSQAIRRCRWLIDFGRCNDLIKESVSNVLTQLLALDGIA